LHFQGSHFFYPTNGSQFFIRGIDYYDSGGAKVRNTVVIDSLAERARCVRDIPYLLRLGINTIYVTSIDLKADHSPCMKLFQDAGIQVLVAINGKNSGLGFWAGNGQKDAGWNYQTFEAYLRAIDVFQGYPNVLGFMLMVQDSFIEGAQSLPIFKGTIKAAKEYMSSKKYRKIPIGISSRQTQRSLVAQYMNCGDLTSSIDFLALEISIQGKSQCQNSTSRLEDGLVESYRDYTIPTFFFYGCPANQTTDFEEVKSIYNSSTTEVFSGGIVYEWMEDNEERLDFGKYSSRISQISKVS
jgi:hypothetical protein